MTTQTNQDSATPSQSHATRAVSIDVWAVVLALGLSLLVYAGVIKHVPW